MVCKYTSKTSTEIKVIIGTLEDSLADANATGKQKIDYNGTTYEISDYLSEITKQLNYWREQLCVAEKQEGLRTIPRRFKRYEGYC